MGCQHSNIEALKNQKKPNIQRKLLYNIVFENLKIQKTNIEKENEYRLPNFNETFITPEFTNNDTEINSNTDWMKNKEIETKIKEFAKIKEIVKSYKTLEKTIFLQKSKTPYTKINNKIENFSQRYNHTEKHKLIFSNVKKEQILLNLADDSDFDFTFGEIKDETTVEEGFKNIEVFIDFWENNFYLKILQNNCDVENNLAFDFQNEIEKIKISHQINDLDYFSEVIQIINKYKYILHIEMDLNLLMNFFGFMRKLRIMNFSINLQLDNLDKINFDFELSLSIEKYFSIDNLNTLITKKNETLINLMKFLEENKFFIHKFEYNISKDNNLRISFEGFNFLDIIVGNHTFKANYISISLDNENILDVSWKEDSKEAKEINFEDLKFSHTEMLISKTKISEIYILTGTN